MSRIKLIPPHIIHEKQAIEYVLEFVKSNSELHGASQLCKFVAANKYQQWVLKTANHGAGFVDEGYVPADTYFAVRESDDKIIGMSNIRHIFDFDLSNEGWSHIGYAVRPSERRKGYATEILRLSIVKCVELGLDKVLVTCDKVNIASAKTILKNGGLLIDEVMDNGEIVEMYIIDLLSHRFN